MLNSPLCRTAAPRLHRSASTAAPRLRPLQLLLPDCINPLQLLLPVCVRFSCCSQIASIRFNCCSPFASATAAAPRLRPLQLLLPIASASTAVLRLHLLVVPASCSGRFQPMPGTNVLEHSSRSLRFSELKYEGRASLV